LKQAFSPEDFIRRRRSYVEYEYDQAKLSRLKTPILILHARDYVLSDPSVSIAFAQRLGAEMSLIDGSSVFGDAEQGIRAIESLLARHRPEGTESHPQHEHQLSTREVEVLRLIAAGNSNQQIAGALVL